MEDHKTVIIVVVLGITAIVMMGLVAKIGLLEDQVENPRLHDNLRRQNVPSEARRKTPGDSPAGANEGGEGTAAASETKPAPASNASNGSATNSAPAANASPTNPTRDFSFPANGAAAAVADVEKSLLRLAVADHKEELKGVGVAVGDHGLLLTDASLLAGGYEAWGVFPESKRSSPPLNRCLAWSPETNLAILRLDDQDEPLKPLLLADKLPVKADKLYAWYEAAKLDLGRSEVTVQGLLNTGDVESKLQIQLPDLGDAVWIEVTGSFPPNVQGIPLVNKGGELAGMALLDSQKAAGAAPAKTGFGGGAFASSGATGPSLSVRPVYVLAHDSLAPLIEKASTPTNDVLFTLDASPIQPLKRSAAPAWTVKLENGVTLDAKSFAAASAATGTGTLNYPGGGRCATLALTERKNIDGPLTVFYPDGKELLHASLAQGRREGPLAVSNAQGQTVLAVQFDRDEREGYCAYFKGGAPWLVQEFSAGKPGAQFLIKQGTVFRTVPAGQPLAIVDAVLSRYGDWSQWDASLKAVESAVERWAKEADRHQRSSRNSRSNTEQLNDAQREAVAAIEELRKLVE